MPERDGMAKKLSYELKGSGKPTSALCVISLVAAVLSCPCIYSVLFPGILLDRWGLDENEYGYARDVFLCAPSLVALMLSIIAVLRTFRVRHRVYGFNLAMTALMISAMWIPLFLLIASLQRLLPLPHPD
jgi:hypothetical protein